jgi:hypothetical protein
MVLKVLDENTEIIPEDYTMVSAIMRDIVFTEGFVEIKQMIWFLRILTALWWGKEAGPEESQSTDRTWRSAADG